jgi:hypothetical protein
MGTDSRRGLAGLFTRDSFVWWIGVVAAVVVALASLQTCDPHVGETMTGTSCGPTTLTYYGIPDRFAPYLRLAAFILAILSAKNMTSGRPHSEEGRAKITASGE